MLSLIILTTHRLKITLPVFVIFNLSIYLKNNSTKFSFLYSIVMTTIINLNLVIFLLTLKFNNK